MLPNKEQHNKGEFSFGIAWQERSLKGSHNLQRTAYPPEAKTWSVNLEFMSYACL